MKKCFLAIACMAIGLCSCQSDNEPGNDQNPGISARAKAAFGERYPQATDVEWTLRQGYAVAEFTMPVVRATVANRHTAWFDNQGGGWHMTESDLLFDALPEAVRTAFAASDYATWRIDDIDQVLREGAEVVYVIEVEGNNAAGVATEMDLYYSADGVLVKQVADTGDDYDYADYIPASPSEGIRQFVEANYPQARIVDIDVEQGMTEVEILDSRTLRELLFDASGTWVHTKTEVGYGSLPAAVAQALEASAYASYRIDDVDHYKTPSGEYYRFELESAEGDAKVRITPAGELTAEGQDPSLPGGGGSGNGGMTDAGVREFISQKYPGSSIIEFDYDDGMLEVEIVHEGREKEVRFNGAKAWVETRWDIARAELPAAVSTAIANSAYASYRIDDIEYVQTPSADYYLVELERGEQEVKLRIAADGTMG